MGSESANRPWKRRCPNSYGELAAIFDKLETHYRDMQDIEFTVEQGKLWMLQTRNGQAHGERLRSRSPLICARKA